MKCIRCQAEMSYERFYYHYDNFWGWRCIFCGEIIDEVIIENRLKNKSR